MVCKNLTALFTLMLLSIITIGQNYNSSLPKVRKAFYTDKTPPLKNMKIVLPGEEDIISGSVELELYAVAIAPCIGENTDEMTLTIDQCTDVYENINQTLSLKLFPNPTKSIVSINVFSEKEEKFTLSVLNFQGQQIFGGDFIADRGKYNNQIDFTYFPKGIYYVIVKTENSAITKKVILE
jgi:hypothetical protein